MLKTCETEGEEPVCLEDKRNWAPLAILVLVSLLGVDRPLVAASGDLRLVDAVKRQDMNSVRTLLRQHVDVNVPAPDGTTPLHWGAYWDDMETVDLLLDARAHVNARNELGATPLGLACTNGSAPMVARLLSAGADVNAPLQMGETPLMAASRTGNADAVSALLMHGANANAVENARGQTALMWAVAERHADVVKLLIEHGADIRARSNVQRRFVRMSNLLAGSAAYTNAAVAEEDQGGFTPLLFAARDGDLESARLLVAAGADVNDTAPSGRSALIVATHSGQSAVAAFLLDKGADPNAIGAGYTALHAAVLRGDLESVKVLVRAGADPNARLMKATAVRRRSIDWAMNQSWVGATPFWLAAKFAEITLVRVLLEHGADPFVTNSLGTTALMAAVTGTIDRWGDSPADGFYHAAPDPPTEDKAIREAVSILLQSGVDINASDEAGDTALHLAAARRLESVVRFLVEKSARLDVRNKKGQTALMMTAIRLARGEGDGGTVDATIEGRSAQRTAELLRQVGAQK